MSPSKVKLTPHQGPRINKNLFSQMDIGTDLRVHFSFENEGFAEISTGEWEKRERESMKLMSEQECCLYELYAYGKIRELASLRNAMNVITGRSFSDHDIFLGLRNIHQLVSWRFSERMGYYCQLLPFEMADHYRFIDINFAWQDEMIRISHTWGPQNIAATNASSGIECLNGDEVTYKLPSACNAAGEYYTAIESKAIAENPERYARYVAAREFDDLSKHKYPINAPKMLFYNKCFSEAGRDQNVVVALKMKWPDTYKRLKTTLNMLQMDGTIDLTKVKAMKKFEKTFKGLFQEWSSLSYRVNECEEYDEGME